ncbi:MAG: cyclic nucleotide-binding domain-containing protein [Chloroflexota bacterium]
MIPIPNRAAFFQKIHLFHDLTEDDLTRMAEIVDEKTYEAGEVIIEQGSRGESFYLIHSGRVKVTRRTDKGEVELAVLVRNDYFGEEEILSNRPRTASITAISPTRVFILTREDFAELIKRAPQLKPNFDVTVSSHRLWRRLRFKWIRPGEVVYFLARKHLILLWRALFGPIFFLFIGVTLFLWGIVAGSAFAVTLGVLGMIAVFGWAGWIVLDWSNDYYVVTNQRAVWIEKIIGIYDSRQEAPLATILSVGVETDPLGRILDYGNVVVRTFVGRIDFSHVGHPYHAARMIEEHWQRTKEMASGEEKEAMKAALREKLGLTTPAPVEKEKPKKQDRLTLPKLYRPTIFSVIGGNIFKFRIEDAGTITYRKHGFVLFSQIWQPSFFLIAILALWITHFVRLVRTPDAPVIALAPDGLYIDSYLLALPLIALPFFGWLAYQWVDWANDVFQVTADQIIDLDRTPFGATQRRAAPLDNILSTEYQRLGLLGYLFNFGTVYITVGGSKLEFQDVYDPAAVQQDIDTRRAARVAGRRAAEKAAERDRMAEWLATYHTSAGEFEAEQRTQDGESQPAGDGGEQTASTQEDEERWLGSLAIDSDDAGFAGGGDDGDFSE